MSRVISIHEYELKPGVDEGAFLQALHLAQESGLLRMPGLAGVHFVKGLRGARRGKYAAMWIYESREVWEELWGVLERPLGKEDYPENWRVWEEKILARFLDRDANEVIFTAYEEI